MADVILANKLAKAIPPGAHLLLVGDVGRLPSLDAGEVLRDLLAAGTLPGGAAHQDLPEGALPSLPHSAEETAVDVSPSLASTRRTVFQPVGCR